MPRDEQKQGCLLLNQPPVVNVYINSWLPVFQLVQSPLTVTVCHQWAEGLGQLLYHFANIGCVETGPNIKMGGFL